MSTYGPPVMIVGSHSRDLKTDHTVRSTTQALPRLGDDARFESSPAHSQLLGIQQRRPRWRRKNPAAAPSRYSDQ